MYNFINNIGLVMRKNARYLTHEGNKKIFVLGIVVSFILHLHDKSKIETRTNCCARNRIDIAALTR